MSLTSVINAAVAQLTPLYPTLVSKIGGELLHERDGTLRLVWVPTSDSFAPAKLAKVEPRPIATRVAGCECHIWTKAAAPTQGSDHLDAAEALVNDVVAALFKVVSGPNLKLRGGSWVMQTKMEQGRAYVLSFEVELPVTLRAVQTVVITAETQNLGMTFPDGSTVSGSPGV